MRLKAVKLIVLGVLVGSCFAIAVPAQAQEDKAPKSEKSGKTVSEKGAKAGGDKKKTNIDFEDELIEGELKKPELFYLLQKKQFNFKRLIKLREDFLPEMRRDADEIRRGRS